MGLPPQKPLGQVLKEMELIDEGQLQEAMAAQREKGGALGDLLVQLGYVSGEDLHMALAIQRNFEIINLAEMDIPQEVIDKVSASFAVNYKVIPVKFEDGKLTVAMYDPNNINAIDDLRYMLRCEIQGAITTEDEISKALEKYYKTKESLEQVFGEMGEDDLKFEEIRQQPKDKGAAQKIEDMVDAAPVKKLLNLILLQAIKEKASDIHFEPFETDFKVRYRVDGVLYEIQSPPLHLASSLVSRIKVMSNLDITETRLPQDGRILLEVKGKPIDLRVSTLPTIYGESVVMRVLDRSVVKLDMENVGLRDEEAKLIKNLVNLPHGIIIVTGPTGSGKTTTLYSILNYLNDIKWKILTAEDPVEYDLDGIIQCQINDDIEVTYANLLRTMLRQDPDIILIGEVRDLETAGIAIESSLTGHLVFSTLHTNDAPSAITRLIDLGVEPFLICATLEAIVAQRLVRRICSNCKEEITPTEDMLIELGLTLNDTQGKKFCWGRGCETCNHTGYKGRQAIFEIMLLTDKLKELIMKSASTDAIREAAREQGMRMLREAGLLAIYDGNTTIEEVVRETLFTA